MKRMAISSSRPTQRGGTGIVVAFWMSAPVLLVTIAVFAPVLFADRTFAFRDAAHFFPPLWRMTFGEWSAGRIPLWNPYENLGQPLLANPTAAVCYPGQLLFLLPLPFLEAFKVYIVGHVLLAAAAAYRLARAFKSTRAAAVVCALAYAFSGTVLMQHTNPPFLVGAAWLPLAVLCIDRIARLSIGGLFRGEPGGSKWWSVAAVRWSVGLGTLLAMMVLGGDPQMAYNVGLIAALYLTIALMRRRRGLTALKQVRWESLRSSWRPVVQAAALFGGAALVAVVLAAVQLLPAWQFAGRSDRVPPQWRDLAKARLQPHSHHEHVYHFSVGPWRLAEFLWPNVAGRQYPVNRRWFRAIRAEGRVWTPTLYMGILPVVLGLTAMRFRRGSIRHRWLSWLVLLSTLAGFGYYGLGWLLREFGVDTALGGPFGGLYWLMTLVLPGYVRFRYPAKLLVVTALALSVLASIGWDRAFSGHSGRVYRMLVRLGVLSLLGCLSALAVRPFWAAWMAAVPADPLFGPLDATGAWRDLASGFGQTALLCAIFGWLVRMHMKTTSRKAGRLLLVAPQAALVLLAVELGWSNAWIVATAPTEVAESASRFAGRIADMAADGPRAGEPVSARVWRYPIWLPAPWGETGSVDRLTTSMCFDRDTIWPNHHLDFDIAVVEVHGTMMPRSFGALLAARSAGKPDRRVRVLDLASYAVTPPAARLPLSWERLDRLPGAVLWHNRRPLPRAWIADADYPERPRNPEAESCHVVYFDPQRVVVDANLREPGLLVLAEQFYPGWRLEVSRAWEGGRDVPIRRANEAMRSAELRAGAYRLTFVFRPRLVFLGAAISAVGWLLLAAWTAWTASQRLNWNR